MANNSDVIIAAVDLKRIESNNLKKDINEYDFERLAKK
jgi:hypothetical protein